MREKQLVDTFGSPIAKRVRLAAETANSAENCVVGQEAASLKELKILRRKAGAGAPAPPSSNLHSPRVFSCGFGGRGGSGLAQFNSFTAPGRQRSSTSLQMHKLLTTGSREWSGLDSDL